MAHSKAHNNEVIIVIIGVSGRPSRIPFRRRKNSLSGDLEHSSELWEDFSGARNGRLCLIVCIDHHPTMNIAVFRLAASSLHRKDSLDCCSPAEFKLVSSLLSTPLHYAVVGGNELTVRLLVGRGINVNTLNVYRESALHWACKEGNTKIIRFLLENWASPNALDSDGNTPMHWAAEYNHGKAIHLLIKYGGLASLNAINGEGLTSLQVAKLNYSRRASRAIQKGDPSDPVLK